MCKLGKLLASVKALAKPDRDLILRWLQDGQDGRGRRVSAEVLSVVLRTEGHRVGPTTLKDHRGGRCACYREAG